MPGVGFKNTALFAIAAGAGLALMVITLAGVLTPAALIAWAVSYRASRKEQRAAAAEAQPWAWPSRTG